MKSFREFIAEKAANLVGLRPEPIQAIIDEETTLFGRRPSVTVMNHIPDTMRIPIAGSGLNWIKVPDIICCFVDMEGSTKLSAELHEHGTAKAYRYFTNTAIKIFHHFEAAYIDVKGDGVFALFDFDQPHRALAATVSFKTFVAKDFNPRLQRSSGLDVGGHYGIDRGSVLVRKLGLKAIDRTDRQNEVWAGQPINVAAKLASISHDETVLVSDRFFQRLAGGRALKSCGCQGGQYTAEHTDLWQEVDVSTDKRFEFDRAWSLRSSWCSTHGKEYCRDIVRYDVK
jgi:class 3 adenylate cyclase